MIFAKEISFKRKLFYTFTFLIFVLSSVLITFLAFGYRFNFKNKIFIYSGTISLKTTPKNVDIFLDHKPIKKKSFEFINNSYNIHGLKPGSYFLEVKKEGFSSWSKQINIHSGLATEFWNIVLIPQTLNNKRLDIINPTFYKINHPQNSIIYASYNDGPLSIWSYSLKKDTAFKIFEDTKNKKTSANLEFLEISPNGEAIIFGIKDGENYLYYLGNLENVEKSFQQNEQGLIMLNQYFGQNNEMAEKDDLTHPLASLKEKTLNENEMLKLKLKNFQWIDDQNLYFMSQKNLYRFNIRTKEKILVLQNINGYGFSQSNIFWVNAPNNLVFKSDKDGNNKKQITENLIDQDVEQEHIFYKLFVYDENRLALLNSKKELYLYNNHEEEYQIFKKIFEECEDAQFSDDGKKLLFFSNKEARVYFLREWESQPKNKLGKNLLVLDNSKGHIKKSIWFSNYQHLIIEVNDSIIITELDTRDKINSTEILKVNTGESAQLQYDSSHESIFYLNKSDSFNQIFYTNIVEK